MSLPPLVWPPSRPPRPPLSRRLRSLLAESESPSDTEMAVMRESVETQPTASGSLELPAKHVETVLRLAKSIYQTRCHSASEGNRQPDASELFAALLT
jgi:hypothetical protein